MSIASEVTRLAGYKDTLEAAKSNIAASITAKGGTVGSGDGFSAFSAAILSIPSGVPLPSSVAAGSTPVASNASMSRRNGTTYGDMSISITIKKAGTYTFRWVMFRTAASGTYGTQLYKNNTAQGTAKTTFTNSYYAACTQNITCAAGDVVKLYGRSNGSTTYIYAGMLEACINWTNTF